MAKINLLPWRAELREQRKREFLITNAAAFLLAVVIAGLIWLYFNNRLDDQLQANAQITNANQSLDRQLSDLKDLQARRDQIVARMKVIQDLQGKRPVVVRLFDELTRLVPANMYLTLWQRGGDKNGNNENRFTIEGYAESPNTVSEFLRNLEGSSWFKTAIMNSYTGPNENATKPTDSGGVAPRPEDAYGHFVVTVDLEEQAIEDPANPKGVVGAGSGS